MRSLDWEDRCSEALLKISCAISEVATPRYNDAGISADLLAMRRAALDRAKRYLLEARHVIERARETSQH